MKRKRGSKSKDRDKSKLDDTKSLKHSRRKRKSSDSESEDDTPELNPEQIEESKSRRPISKKSEEVENSAASTRITRHSKRLAAISASSDELKDEISDVTSSPVKTGKSSPHSSGSPSKDLKKRDSGTPDKHRAKDQDVWKVKSANGAGSGELQKLKICRQRSPENIPFPEEPSSNNVLETPPPQDGEPSEAKEEEAEESLKNSTSDAEGNVESETNPINIADIQLPATKFVEESKTSVESTGIDSVVGDNTASSPIHIEAPEPVLSEQEGTSVNVEIVESPSVNEEKTPVLNDATVTENDVENVGDIQLPPESVSINEKPIDILTEESQMSVDNAPEVVVTKPSMLPEQEDTSQAEIVLTVDEHVIEEPSSVAAVVPESDEDDTKNREVEVSRKTEIIKPTLKSVDIEEVYDYENDDAKEEGELSPNESMSPIHEVFKKYPVNLRKRSWGLCNISHFNKTNIVVDENTLKEYNIKKRTISKEEFDASDSEDLIFVKEIREENIVHEIESETNNTSFYDKDDDAVPSSPKFKSDGVENKKRLLDSDKIQDRPSKRIVKDKAPNGEGKTVLYITNLVRPFTVNQLRELLLRTGRIVEDGFWIDSIKSKCYVQFENEDEALETRHALHGIRWPVNNPKVLNVQFASQDDLLSAQAQTHESEIPRKTEPLVVSNHTVDPVLKRIDWKKHFEQYDERPKKIKDVREWDIGKPAHPDEMVYADDLKKKDDQDAARRSRKDKRRRNDISDDEVNAKKPRKQVADNQPAPEAKLLDDLFRRTKAAPSIYWLPLSEEQIAIKQETRRKHLEDIDRQMKKRNSDQDSRRRDRERRRSRR